MTILKCFTKLYCLILITLPEVSLYSQSNIEAINLDSVIYKSKEFNSSFSCNISRHYHHSINFSDNFLFIKPQSCNNQFEASVFSKDSVLIEKGVLFGTPPFKDTMIIYNDLLDPKTGQYFKSIYSKKCCIYSKLIRVGSWEYYNKKGLLIKTINFNEKEYTKEYFTEEQKRMNRLYKKSRLKLLLKKKEKI